GAPEFLIGERLRLEPGRIDLLSEKVAREKPGGPLGEHRRVGVRGDIFDDLELPFAFLSEKLPDAAAPFDGAARPFDREEIGRDRQYAERFGRDGEQDILVVVPRAGEAAPDLLGI